MISIELSPVEADKVLEYIDGKVRQGGVDSAIELAPLAVKIREGLASFRDEPEEVETFESFSHDEDLSEIAEAAANGGVIDATDDELGPFS